MAAYNGISKRIRNALVSVIAGIQVDTGAGPGNAFAEVVGDTATEFDSYPSVRVLPRDLANDKAAVATSNRTQALIARVHLPLENKEVVPLAVIDQMFDLTDLLLDELDEADFISALNTYDITLNTYLLNATRAGWTVGPSGSGVIISCDVNIDIEYSKEL